MAYVTSAPSPIWLITGDEDLLIARVIESALATVRADDPNAHADEIEAGSAGPGELAELFSPSLFGGQRIAVLRSAQDARKETVAQLLAYAKDPDPDLILIVVHAGGAKGKALADGLKAAGAQQVNAAKITRARERVEFVRNEFRRLGGRCPEDAAEALIAAVGTDLRELAAAASQLVADTDGRIT